jgi:4-amino-4-deoxy-L-arabinose transferase-like glycosyltransferase
LIAGAVLAVTPAATLMFRYNNPDALMVLLITMAAYCCTRAVASASWRWLALVGVALGFAFLTKMLAGLLVLPAVALAYLLFAPTTWRLRAIHLLGAAAALVVSSGWWIAVVQLWPVSARPYVGGSADDSVLNLALGYNGIDRIVAGGERTSGADTHLDGWATHSGIQRMFSGEMGYEVSWLLPAVVVAIIVGGYLALRGRLNRNDKAALVMWNGWFVVSAALFSYMSGMVHPYYTIALAPAMGALVGLAAVWSKPAGPVMALSAAAWGVVLLHRAEIGPAWIRWAIGFAAVVGVVILVAAVTRLPRLTPVAVALVIAAALAATTVFAVATAATPHNGSIPNAAHTANVWPTVGHRFEQTTTIGAGSAHIDPLLADLLRDTRTTWAAATSGSQAAASLEIATGTAIMAVGGWSSDPVPTLDQFVAAVHAGEITYYVDSGRLRARDHNGAQIKEWVARNYRPAKVGGTTVFPLLRPIGGLASPVMG